jgi:hypothetical protein
MQSKATRFFFFTVMDLTDAGVENFWPEFRKLLTGRETARFYKSDWRLDLMINLQLAQTLVINL